MIYNNDRVKSKKNYCNPPFVKSWLALCNPPPPLNFAEFGAPVRIHTCPSAEWSPGITKPIPSLDNQMITTGRGVAYGFPACAL